MPHRHTLSAAVLAVTTLTVLATPSSRLRADGLERYVPAGVHFFGKWRPSADAKRLAEPVMDAFERLVASGIGEDILALATLELDDDERQEVRAVVKRVFEICGKPDWEALCSGETAFTFRLDAPLSQYAALARVKEGTGADRFGELGELLRGLASFGPEHVAVTEEERDGASIVRLAAASIPLPAAVNVARRGDLIVMASNDELLAEILRLASANTDADTGSIATVVPLSAREAEGKGVFRLREAVRFVQELLGMAMLGAGEDPNAKAAFAFANRVLEELARLQRITWDETYRGDRSVVDSTLSLAQVDGPGFIERAIAETESIHEAVALVPHDAIGFRVTSGCKPLTLYDAALDAVREYCPSGDDVLGSWASVQEEAGFDVREDLLSWLAGGGMVIELPGGTMALPECVCLVRVSDVEKARAALKRLREKCEPYVESRGHAVDIVALDDLSGLHEVRIATMPWLRPVVGVIGESMVFASSADSARKCAATLRGEAPSIREHPDFAALEVPDGPLTDIYYHHVPRTLSRLCELAGTVGFVASLVPEEDDTRPVILAGAIIAKLATFIRELDCVESVGGWSRYDGEAHVVEARQVMRFRSP